MSEKRNFTDFLASRDAIAYNLFVGVIFLFTNYVNVLHYAQPSQIEGVTETNIYLIFYFVFAVVDALFFGFTTVIVIFQSNKDWIKRLFCVLEGIMVMLSLNRDLIEKFTGGGSQGILSVFIGLFSGFAFYVLGSLAYAHVLERKERKKEILEKEIAENERIKELEEALDNEKKLLKSHNSRIENFSSEISERERKIDGLERKIQEYEKESKSVENSDFMRNGAFLKFNNLCGHIAKYKTQKWEDAAQSNLANLKKELENWGHLLDADDIERLTKKYDFFPAPVSINGTY